MSLRRLSDVCVSTNLARWLLREYKLANAFPQGVLPLPGGPKSTMVYRPTESRMASTGLFATSRFSVSGSMRKTRAVSVVMVKPNGKRSAEAVSSSIACSACAPSSVAAP